MSKHHLHGEHMGHKVEKKKCPLPFQIGLEQLELLANNFQFNTITPKVVDAQVTLQRCREFRLVLVHEPLERIKLFNVIARSRKLQV